MKLQQRKCSKTYLWLVWTGLAENGKTRNEIITKKVF